MRGASFAALDLGDASASAIGDDIDETAWSPGEGLLVLDGFEYERIARGRDGETSSLPTDLTRNRLKWLRRQRRFTRQPYLRLAKVLKGAGT